jgi:hypothetical protein
MDEITPLITKIQAKHWLRLKPSPWVLYPALLVLGFAIGMIQGPSVQFIMDITCDRIDSTKVASRPREQCNSDPQVQASVSNLLMIMQLVCSITGYYQKYISICQARVVALTDVYVPYTT